MVQTRRQDYGSPRYAPVLGETYLEGTDIETLEEEVHSPLFIVHPRKPWRFSVFEDIDDHGGGSMV